MLFDKMSFHFRLNETTEGSSLRANLALIENNAKVGADIAVELAKISSQSSFNPSKKIAF